VSACLRKGEDTVSMKASPRERLALTLAVAALLFVPGLLAADVFNSPLEFNYHWREATGRDRP